MLRHHLRVALRSLGRRRGYIAINVVGLALGLACTFFILQYIRDEQSYDRFHTDADRIYRLVTDQYTVADTALTALTSAPMAPALAEEFPEVDRVVRLYPTGALVARGERRFQEERVFYADSSLFDVFSFPLVAGDPATALRAPGSIVLTETTAQKYFGDGDPLGQTLVLDGEEPFTVTGVLDDVPSTSHLQFDVLLSHASWASEEDNWFWFGWHSYVLLPAGYDPARLERALPAFLERHVGAGMREVGFSFDLSLEPLSRVYLHSEREGAAGPVGRASTLYVFGAIALFTLLIALVNFVNLSTARAAGRAREVGVRKAVGSTRGQLATQFLGESVLLSLLAFGVAVAIVLVLRVPYEAVSGKTLDLSPAALMGHGAGLFALALGAGLVAGVYPALVLSGFRPAAVLGGRFQTSPRGVALRKGLIVVQFAITFGLLVGTGTVFSQLDYLRGEPLGVDAERLLVLDFRGDDTVRQRVEAVRAELASVPGVSAATFSNVVPGVEPWNLTTSVEGPDGALVESNLDTYFVDHDFVHAFGVHVVAGRSFSRSFPTDSVGGFVVNEATVRQFGWGSAEAAIGKRMARGSAAGEVIGVVEDFHVRSLHRAVEPLALQVDPQTARFLALRVNTADLPRTIAAVEAAWARVAPDRPVEHFSLDQRFVEQYAADERFGRVFGVFAVLATVIACLGLFGLAAYAVEQRTKEVGVRKVLGASAASIAALFAIDVATLVLAAVVGAAPLAYLAMSRWLEGFAYRVELGPGVFLVAGAITLAVALTTVSAQTLRAASADPVKALRSE